MPRTPPKNVVVITGASSAVGQALALEFAVRGDAVVVSATSDELLEAPKRACEMLGAWTHGFVVPERSERAMRELADSAVARFGRIDIWVNHAAPFARFEGEDNGAALASEMATFEHGAKVALSHFSEQGHGVLVNVDGYANISLVSDEDRAAVRSQFLDIEGQAAAIPDVSAHSINTLPGQSWQDLAKQMVGLARGEARGDYIGRAISILARQQMRLRLTAKKARRKVIRDDEAHTAVLAGTSGARRTRSEGSTRRGGWHLAYSKESEQTTSLMAIVALPLLMAAGMFLLVR
jgi:NAD(P)-dependent dehydrogenase (short-subunit alcohol dehydrogenase family)